MRKGKFLRLFEEGRYSEIVDNGKCPMKLLHLILISDNVPEHLKARASATITKKEHYANERELLSLFRKWYKEACEKDNTDAIDLLCQHAWNLDVVQRAYFYKVIIPKFGNINMSRKARRSYESADTHLLEWDFIDSVLKGEIRV